MATKPVWHLKVDSSNINKASFNVAKETFTIWFTNGNVYKYFKVTLEEFTEFTLAESQGKWFNKNIKNSKEFYQRDNVMN